jgi:putative polyhydroxyalkanoate system protein
MSKAITLTIPHELGRAEARRRIDDGFASLSKHLGAAAGVVSKSWAGDRLTFSLSAIGQEIRGTVDIEDKAVKLEVLLPNLMAMLANKVKGRLRREGQILLEKK